MSILFISSFKDKEVSITLNGDHNSQENILHTIIFTNGKQMTNVKMYNFSKCTLWLIFNVRVEKYITLYNLVTCKGTNFTVYSLS